MKEEKGKNNGKSQGHSNDLSPEDRIELALESPFISDIIKNELISCLAYVSSEYVDDFLDRLGIPKHPNQIEAWKDKLVRENDKLYNKQTKLKTDMLKTEIKPAEPEKFRNKLRVWFRRSR